MAILKLAAFGADHHELEIRIDLDHYPNLKLIHESGRSLWSVFEDYLMANMADIDASVEQDFEPDDVLPGLPDMSSWPWCEPCKSYHHPDNPTCRARPEPADRPWWEEVCEENMRLSREVPWLRTGKPVSHSVRVK